MLVMRLPWWRRWPRHRAPIGTSPCWADQSDMPYAAACSPPTHTHTPVCRPVQPRPGWLTQWFSDGLIEFWLVLRRPSQHRIAHFRDISPWLRGLIWRKLNKSRGDRVHTHSLTPPVTICSVIGRQVISFTAEWNAVIELARSTPWVKKTRH